MGPKAAAVALLLLAAGGGASDAAAAVAPPTVAALAADDACSADRSEGAEACALGALQVSQRRGDEVSQRRIEEAGGQGPLPSVVASGVKEALEAAKGTVETLAALKRLYNEWYPDNFTQDKISEWVLPSHTLLDMWRIPVPLQSSAYPIGVLVAPVATEFPFCRMYPAYLWPQVSFWAGQVGRRLRMVSLDDTRGLRRVQKFAHQASFLSSLFKFDPRAGGPWANHTQPFFRQVAASDSLDMPQLPAFFRRTSMADETSAIEVSMWWFQNMFCDIDWWRRDLMGSKADSKEVCWDKVPHPGYGYSPMGLSVMKDLPPWHAGHDPLGYPEYLACNDYPLNDTLFEGLCPFGGHLESGTYALKSWGSGVPTEEGRQEVLQCQRKMGPMQYSRMTFARVHVPWDLEMALGPPVMDGAAKVNVTAYGLDIIAFVEAMGMLGNLSNTHMFTNATSEALKTFIQVLESEVEAEMKK